MPCIVSAHSSRTKLVTGQVKADEKSNEITAIPALLDLLYLKGAIVTIEAAGCQKKIVRKIMRRGAGYVISLKGNLWASLRSEVPQQPAASVQWDTDVRPLFTGRCAVGCWLLEHFGRRPLRARREDLAENLAMLRHAVLNVLRLDKSVFGGISVKRKELTWDDDKLLSLMLAA